MKKKRLLSLALAMFLLASTFGMTTAFADADEDEVIIEELEGTGEEEKADTVGNASAGPLEYTSRVDDENAYVLFGEKVKANNAKFLDGIELGVKDPFNPLYSTVSAELGIEGRYFTKENLAYIDIDDNFYEEGDDEFFVSIVYFDYGPSQGTFYFDYIDKDGNKQTCTIIKPGTVQKWNVETLYIKGADLGKTIDGMEANVALRQRGFNLFRRVEIANISKAKREKTAVQSVHDLPLGSKRDDLLLLDLLDEKDSRFTDENIFKAATYEDAYEMRQIITDDKTVKVPSDKDPKAFISQNELAKMLLEILGFDCGEKDPVEYAKENGFIEEMDFFFSGDCPASRYSMVELAYTIMDYEKDGISKIGELAASGRISDEVLAESKELLCMSYKFSKKLMPKIVSDNATGRVYYYLNIGGYPTMRPYGATMQTWTPDGKSFLCGFNTGEVFLYNTETYMLTYVDKARQDGILLQATVGNDGYIYYVKEDVNGVESLWKANSAVIPMVPEFICEADPKYEIDMPHLTNDCKFIGVGLINVTKAGDQTDLGRWDVENKKWDILDYEHTHYSPGGGHVVINPEYPDILSFCHELVNYSSTKMYDRMWQADFSDMTVAQRYKQGLRGDGLAMQGATHEVWSYNGEYMYFCSFNLDTYGTGAINVGDAPAVVRYDRDGSHRHYYYINQAILDGDQHCYPSGDDKYVVADGHFVTIISTSTWQRFHIAKVNWFGQTSHPYQAHPCMARNRYVIDWGGKDKDGLLGVLWYDFTDLVKNEEAKGGRYDASDSVEYVSYKGLECESSETNIANRDAIMAKSGKSIFLDVKENVIDSVNGKLKISFDYLDNGSQPIDVYYTSGVEKEDEHWRIYDQKVSVKRTNTNAWKRFEFEIESGNFEDIGKFESDIKISGITANVYITNVTASVPN